MDILFLQYAVICLGVVLFGHGLLLLNDGHYGDSTILEGMLKEGRVRYLLQSSSEFGRPVVGRILAATAVIKNKALFYRFIAVMGMWLIGMFTYAICRATGLLDESVCVAIGLLTTAYSCNQTLMDYSIALMYYFFQSFFLAAIMLILLAMHAGPVAASCMCLAAILLLYLGFQMESQLSYFYGLPLLVGLAYLTGQPGYEGPQPLVVVGWMSLYPFLHWGLKQLLTPKGGANKDYNSFKFNLKAMRSLFIRVLRLAVLRAAIEPFRYLLSRPAGWLTLLPALVSAWMFKEFGVAAIDISTTGSVLLVLFGFVLLLLGAIPYMLIQLPTGVWGWETKNNTLAALPGSLMLIGLVSLAVKGVWFGALLGFVLVFNVTYLACVHLHWIAVWAKHRAVLHALKALPKAEAHTVIAYSDMHPVSGSSEHHEESYTLFLVFLLDLIWPGLRHLAIIEPEPRYEGYSSLEVEVGRQATTVAYMLENVDREGPQASLVVWDGEIPAGPVGSALRYLWTRITAPEHMDEFLGRYARVSFVPMEGVKEHASDRQWSKGLAHHAEHWQEAAERAMRRSEEEQEARV